MPYHNIIQENKIHSTEFMRLLKYFKNREVFCHVTHDKMVFRRFILAICNLVPRDRKDPGDEVERYVIVFVS